LTGSNALLSITKEIDPLLPSKDFSKLAFVSEFENDNLVNNGANIIAKERQSGYYYPMALTSEQFNTTLNSYYGTVTTGVDTGISNQRESNINQYLGPASFTCQECVDLPYKPYYLSDGQTYDCTNNASHQFQFALKVEKENNGGYQPIGTVSNDCRCCQGLSELHYWDDSYYCAGSTSRANKNKCLPLGVLENGTLIGFSNYGFDNKVVPFWGNIGSDIGNLGSTRVNLEAKQINFVINGKLITGEYFVKLKNNTSFMSNKKGVESFNTLNTVNSAEYSTFFCNNSFRGGTPAAGYRV
jgi:hypothetical protein